MSGRRLTLALIVAALLACAAREASQSAGSTRLSADAASTDPLLRRCLAGANGTVARYTDDEPYVAVDPRDADHVVAIWQTRSGSGSVIQWVRSTDGGRRWSAPRVAPINACAGGPVAAATRSSDPWASIGPDGRIYLSAIAWTPGADDGPDLVSALIVVASRDGGATWEPPVAAAIAPSTAISHDNLAITADPTRPGAVYAATTRFDRRGPATFYGRLGFTRSLDGGRTWSAIRAINPGRSGERIGAPQVVVDPRSGSLHAIYFGRFGGNSRIAVMSSDDAGVTWADEVTVAAHVRGAPVRERADADPFVLADDIVQAAVSPRTGRLFIAFADAHRSAGRRYGISLVWSDDGREWSAPLAISDSLDPTAWLPAIAIGAGDEIAVSHYAADFGASASADQHVRVVLRRLVPSANGYSPWRVDVLHRAPLAWPGDYQGLVAVRGGFVGAFGARTDIFARRVEREPPPAQ